MAQLQSTSITGSLIVTQGITGSFSGSISNATSASYAATASYALNAGDSVWTGSAGNIYYNGGNVGIGTASPGGKLDVNGETLFRNRVTINSTAVQTYAQLNVWDTTTGTGTTRIADFTNGIDNNLNIYISQVGASSKYSELASYSSNPLVFNYTAGGNVGIGTINPVAKLYIVGSSQNTLSLDSPAYPELTFRVSGTVKSYDAIVTTNQGYFNTSTVGDRIYRTEAGNHLFGYSTTEIMRIASGGNVGIGTASPGFKLDVNGTVNVAAGSYYRIGSTAVAFVTGNEVQYGNQGGSDYVTISTGTTEKFRITTAGNVGIGTTNPTARIQIANPDAGSDGFQFQRWVYTAGTAGVYELHLKQTVTSGVVRYNFSMINSSTTYNDVLVLDRGNVGIGTTSPGERLQVQTSIRVEGSTPAYNLYESTTHRGNLQWQTTSNYVGVRLFNMDNSNLMFGTWGTERMRIDTNGNVGIGTTTLYQVFTVNKSNSAGAGGYMRLENTVGGAGANVGIDFATYSPEYYGVSGPTAQIKATDITNYAGRLDINVKETGPSGALQTLASFNYTGNVGIGNTSPTQKLDVTGYIRATSGFVGNSGLYLWGDNSSGAAGLFVATAGNVGIGTSSPADKLEVVGNISIGNSYKLYNGSASDSAGITFPGSTTRIDGFYGITFHASSTNVGSQTERMRITPTGNVGIGTTSPTQKLEVAGYGLFQNGVVGASGLTLYGDNSSATGMVLTTSGNVGIGTGSPNARLTVVANDSSNPNVALRLSSTGYSGVPYPYTSIRFGSAYSSYPSWNLASIDAGYTGASWGGSLLFYTNNDSGETNLTERMRITSAGNVGIGTVSPGFKLDVNGSARVNQGGVNGSGQALIVAGSGDVQLTDGGSVFWGAYDYGGSTYIRAYDDSNIMYFYLNGTNMAYFRSDRAYFNVNVGIGTASPASLLHIYGSGNTFTRYTNTTYSGHYIDIGANGAGESFVYGYGAYPLLFGTNGSERMRITSSGNVGIGTTSPTNKLEVIGNIYTPNSIYLGSSGVYSKLGFYRYEGSAVGAMGWHTDDKFYIGGFPGWGATAGNEVRVYGFGANLYLGSTTAGDVVTVTTSGNVGIGITSPAQKLHVEGIARLGGSSADGALYVYSSNGTLNSLVSGPGDTYLNATYGNVGIGNTAPNQKLELSVGNAVTGGLRINYAASATGEGMDITYLNSGNTTTSFDSRYNSDSAVMQFRMKTAATAVTAMTILGNGNVGIGTTNPYSKLEITSTTPSWGEGIIINPASSGYASVFYRVQGTSGSTYTGTWALGKNSSSESGGELLQVVKNGLTGSTGYRVDALQQWKTNGDSIFGFKVGIGTTNPTVPLQVNGVGGDTTPMFRLVGSAAQAFNWASSTEHASLTAGQTSIHLIGKANSQYNQAYFGYRHVSDGSSSNMVTIGMYASDYLLNILGNGNVGIGTTSPGVKLEVVGAIRGGSFPNSTTNSGEAWFGRAADRTLGTMTIQLGGSSATNTFFEIVDRAWSKVMYGLSGEAPSDSIRVTSSGNVGLGTGSPAFPLHVARSSGDSVIVADSGASSNSQFRFQEAGSLTAAITFVSSDDSLRFYNGGDRFTILSSGNIGIGTTSPAALLHVSQPSANTVFRLGNNTTYDQFIYFNGSNDWSMGMDYSNSNAFVLSNYSSLGTNDRLVVTTGGNVGIGTTSPYGKFQVNASNYGESPTINKALLVSDSAAPSKYLILTYHATPDIGIIQGLHEGTAWKNIALNPNGGNVGIGTTSIGYKLYVNGTSYFADTIYNGGGHISWTAGYSDGTTQTYNGNSLAFLTNSSSYTVRMFITSGGNIGIGTTAPLFNLQVGANSGTLATTTIRLQNSYLDTNGYYGFNIDAVDNGVDGHDLRFLGRTTPTGGFSELVRIKNGGNVGIGTTSPSDKLSVVGNVSVTSGDYRIYNGSTILSSTSTSLLEINAGGFSNVSITNGNVGIGITNPSYKLQVAGTSWFTAEQAISYTDSIQSMYGGTGYSLFRMYGNSNGVEMQIDTHAHNSGAATIGTYSNSDVFIKTNQTNRMVVKAGGNVGIGTTSPSRKLDVAGDMTLTTGGYIYGDSTNPYLNLSQTNGTLLAYSSNSQLYLAGSVTTLSAGNNYLGLITNGSERLRITSAGNVGIGLTTPQKILDVYGSAGIVGSFGAGLSVGQFAGIHFGYTESHVGNDNYKKSALVFERTDNNNQGGNASGKIHFLLNNSGGSSATTLSAAVVTIDSDANGTVGSVRMGVGTRNPTATLNVSGSTNVLNVRGSGSATTSSIFSVDGNNGRLFEVSDDLSNSLFSVNTIAGLPVIEAFADYTVTMGTYGAYSLQVTGSRVGVGTSSPGYPLHVSGSVSGISIYATNDIAAFSDQSVKTDLQVIDSAVDRIKQINGYTYVRVDDLSNTRRAGVIAQEVQKVLPEVVSENSDGTLNVAYSNMIALLIEGMKEQQAQIDKLREDLEDLRYEL